MAGWIPWLVLLLVATGCATARVAPPAPGPRAAAPRSPAPGADEATQVGNASWYGHPHHGRRTASGEPYDMNRLTAAHRTLPLGTRVLVTNLDNGRSVEVRINDRGPFVAGRVIDLSRAAARRLGALGTGVIPVRLKIIDDAASEASAAPRSD
jgi:rare lipoprotein A